jgi:hypothetical protein
MQTAFHIGMRFEQLLLSLRGLRDADAYTEYRLEGDVVAAKWLLWNGHKERCFEELEALRRETVWVGAHNPLGKADPLLARLLRPPRQLRTSTRAQPSRLIGGRRVCR